jgi:hypothetical protein
MIKRKCKLCGLLIRRPVDHVYCLGALDDEHLEERQDIKKEVTREIIIPEELHSHKTGYEN